MSCYSDTPIEMCVFHSKEQIDHINGYKNQFGTSKIGLGRILNRAHIGSMYRTVEYADKSMARDIPPTQLQTEPNPIDAR